MTHAQTAEPALLRTPLHACHQALGARMVPFGGWEMPLSYTGITAEHEAVRRRAGLFDVSHMGEVEIAGGDALAGVQRLTCSDAGRLAVGQAQYTVLTTHAGTIVDDLLVYRLGEAHFLLVVNAANIARDYAWIKAEIAAVGDVVAVDTSRRYALLALQGPRAAELLQPLTGVDLATLGAFRFASGEVANVRTTISRTGYTGEDGFELFVPPPAASRLWDALLAAGGDAGLIPAGLGARDTLRLEAGLRLYGADMDETITVLEAGLGWTIAWDKPAFNGKDALVRQRREGPPRRLVGFELVERAIARPNYAVHAGNRRVGHVTSGTRTPSLDTAVGMAYVPAALSAPGTEIGIDVRGRQVAARVVRMPFYRRPGCVTE